jgi:DNA-binding LytR/AlgR family response regulator
VKPYDETRLADTVERLKAWLLRPTARTARAIDEVLERLAIEAAARAAPSGARHLQWIRASVGASVRLIPVEQVVYLRADEKYTLVVWEGGEALIRKTIRELVDELDPQKFAQIHRSVIVNLHQVAQVHRGINETAEVH